MPPLNLLIKPASSMCNLKCIYCFYHSAANQRETANYGFMSIELLEEIVIKALDYADDYCVFAFQGGEPTLSGLEFYKKLIEFQKLYNNKNLKIHNSLQTNGVLIDEKWARFLSDNKFLVGLSIDGPRDINDVHRVDDTGSGSFEKIINAAQLLDEYNVEYNILTVVTDVVAQNPVKVYNFFKKQGFKYQQYIECLDPLGEKPGGNEYSLTPELYAEFLKSTFDMWYNDLVNGNYHSIRTFDNYVNMARGYLPESCGMSGICTCYFVVESDGGVYPCDFYVLDEWLIGNICNMTFDEMIQSQKAKEFVETSMYIDKNCTECKFFYLCKGGCRRCREPFIDGKPVLNYYCEAYKNFFNYAIERIIKTAKNSNI